MRKQHLDQNTTANMSIKYSGTAAALESHDTTTSAAQPRLPNEILPMIGECCIESFEIMIEDVTDKKLNTEEYPKQFVLTGYPKVKNVALASRNLNAGIKSGLRKKFNGHLTLRNVYRVEALDLRSVIALPWLIEQVLDIDEYLDENIPWTQSYIDYSIFPHLHTVTKHAYSNRGYHYHLNDSRRDLCDGVLILTSEQVYKGLVKQQHERGGSWVPGRDGRELYFVFHLKHDKPAVDVVIDISRHNRAVITERRIV